MLIDEAAAIDGLLQKKLIEPYEKFTFRPTALGFEAIASVDKTAIYECFKASMHTFR